MPRLGPAEFLIILGILCCLGTMAVVVVAGIVLLISRNKGNI